MDIPIGEEPQEWRDLIAAVDALPAIGAVGKEAAFGGRRSGKGSGGGVFGRGLADRLFPQRRQQLRQHLTRQLGQDLRRVQSLIVERPAQTPFNAFSARVTDRQSLDSGGERSQRAGRLDQQTTDQDRQSLTDGQGIASAGQALCPAR